MTDPKRFAIVIEDSGELFLFLDIKRSPVGDVYVNFNEHHPNHKPHSSYHASGQLHYKSYGHSAFPIRKLQAPDSKFNGSENIITTNILHGDGRAWNIGYKQGNYSTIMIIKNEIITSEFGYQLAVDLVQSGTAPVGFKQSSIKLVQQQIFNIEIPQIVASLYEPSFN